MQNSDSDNGLIAQTPMNPWGRHLYIYITRVGLSHYTQPLRSYRTTPVLILYTPVVILYTHVHAWIRMDRHEYARTCMNTHEYAKYEYARTCMDVHEYARICMNMNQYACKWINMHAYACMRMHMHEYAWICMNMHEYIWISWICMNMHTYVWICPRCNFTQPLCSYHAAHVVTLYSHRGYIIYLEP